MTRRKTFDPTGVPREFWQRDDVRLTLARREVGRLFGIYLATFPGCTQTQLALATEHDRSDISNFIRGTRRSRVADIDVLARIADGLTMPDEARVLLGLAPAELRLSQIKTHTGPDAGTAAPTSAVTGWYRPSHTGRPPRIAICGSRAPGTDTAAIDDAVAAIARLLMKCQCRVDHGPIGVGIEIMTYIADHYRPPTLQAAVGVFGRPNVIRHADLVLVVGGGQGTLDEVDLAISMGKTIIPFIASGGAAAQVLDRIRDDVASQGWLTDELVAALGACTEAEELTSMVEQLVSANQQPERGAGD